MIIADSSGLISLFVSSDYNHKKALLVSQKYMQKSGHIIIPAEVFSELVNVLGRKFDHLRALDIVDKIIRLKIFLIEPTLEQIRTAALKKFKDQPKSVSFTDCIVMVFADFYDTKEIFGFDEAFKRNKYQVPKPD